MTYFLPSDSLVRTWQTTIQVLAIIAGFIAVMAAGTLALHMLIWFCGVLVTFIRSFSGVCHAAYDAVGGSPATMAMTLITIAMILFIIKIACVLFPSLSFFRVQEVRV
jgi:hypothetical protein